MRQDDAKVSSARNSTTVAAGNEGAVKAGNSVEASEIMGAASGAKFRDRGLRSN